jgi:D-sedoheptulose 7-phosphate isomerase
MKNILINHIKDHIQVTSDLMEKQVDQIIKFSDIISSAIEEGNMVYLFGNGGSAADAQHIAAEFTGRFVKERKGLAAIALTTDTSALTAIGNDYGFDYIFERQVEALAKKGDVLIGISTSGNSLNVCKALKLGNEIGCVTLSLTGNKGGEALKLSHFNLNINHSVTARIQEMHILIGHLICTLIDEVNFVKN